MPVHCLSGDLLKRALNFILCSVALLLWSGTSQAQTQASISVAPSSLAFGIPTGTSPATSAAQSVIVSITGSGSVTFSSVTIGASGTTVPPSTSNPSAFTITGNSCTGTLTAPTNCQVAVVFSSTSTSLQAATLTISATGFDAFIIQLTGAYGAINLFQETNETVSVASASFSDLFTIGNANLNLSCPTSPTATISGTPDGSGNVLVDNYLQLSINGSPVSNGGSPAGNVCTGGVTDSFDDATQQDCFTQAYRNSAETGSLVGLDPDTFANSPNSVLTNGAAGGVAPIQLITVEGTSLFPTGSFSATINTTDAGGWYTSTTLFLVTNCTQTGITPGGSATGSAINSNTTTQTQTLPFDTIPGQNISLTTSDALAIQQGTIPTPSNIVPIVTDIGITQAQFSALIQGTSAAPAVCLRLTGEVDPTTGLSLCKGFLIQCYNPATETTSGENCDPTASNLRNLYDSSQFTSPDAPSGVNYLGSACAFYLSTLTPPISGGTCASSSGAPGLPGPTPKTLIGPGMLMGGDNWLTTPYSGSNCAFSGILTGNSCPFDTLTQFKGAADPAPGSTMPGRNSVYVAVVDMPLPFTDTSINSLNGPENASGWVNSSSVTASFVSNEATYLGTGSNPPANEFTPAPPYSLTYGITAASVAVPDPTFPVPGDTTNYNATVVAPGTPGYPQALCPAGSATPNPFDSTSGLSFIGIAQGVYNLHYFTTDCALTEELWFNPSTSALTNPTSNWASFAVLAFGVDTEAPSLTCTPPAPVYNGWYNSNVTLSCSASDNLSGFASATTPPTAVPNTNGTVLQGPLTENFTVSAPTVNPGQTVPDDPVAVQTVTDLAGNVSNTQGPYSFPIDLQAPVITGPGFAPVASGNKYTVPPIGQTLTVTITYSCSDGVGSGVASCIGVATPPLPGGLATSCTLSLAGELDTCTSSFAVSPANVGSYTFTVSTADNVGNAAKSSPVAFSVGYAQATVLSGAVVLGAVQGGTLTYLGGAIDASPANTPTSIYGATINVSFAIPSGALASGTATAGFWDISCSPSTFPLCLVPPKTTTPCTVSPSTVSGSTTTVVVSCNVGNLTDAFTNKTGVGLMIQLPISKTASGTITSIQTITAANPLTGITSFPTSTKILK
jgi:hypothetical protein